MAVTVTVPNHWKYLLMQGGPNFESDTFMAILMDTGFTFDRDSHALYADISASELATGNGYTVKTETLTGVALTEDDSDDRAEVTWSNPAWTASGGAIGPTPGCCIIDDSLTDDPVVMYIISPNLLASV